MWKCLRSWIWAIYGRFRAAATPIYKIIAKNEEALIDLGSTKQDYFDELI